MTYTFKLSRRMAIAYCPPMLFAGLLLLVGCNDSELTSATDVQAVQVGASATETYARGGKGRGRDKRESTAKLVRIVVSPDPATVAPGGSKRFSADGVLSDGMKIDAKVKWNASGGTIDSTGLFTAGKTVGRYRVSAQSEEPQLADTASVTIGSQEANVTGIVLSPATVTLQPGGDQRWTATARLSDGSTAPATVTYQATGGSIDPDGLYTAGQTAGSFRVIATHAAGPADTAKVTIEAPQVPAPSPSGPVSAGPDTQGSAGQSISLNGSAPNGWKTFWSVVSGPGPARFAHDQVAVSFEDGTTNEWTGTPTRPIGDGTQGVDGPFGRREANTRTSQSRAHLGRWSWEAYNDPNLPYPQGISAKLLRWGDSYSRGYIQGWMYWPSNLRSLDGQGKYINVLQWKENAPNYEPTYVLAVKPRIEGCCETGPDEWVIHSNNPQSITRTGRLVPKDRWVQVTAYIVASKTAGELWFWVDGELLWKGTGLNTLDRAGQANTQLQWGVGNYGYPVGKGLWWDDLSLVPDRDVRQTSATFSQPGTYVVRLTASDGSTTTSDVSTVTVR